MTTPTPEPIPASDPHPVLVVTHGAPSHPVSQEIWVRDLALRLQAHLPGRVIRGATLAAPGALDRAIRDMACPAICPWFMSDGWFVRSNLPKRLRQAGLAEWRMLDPVGLLPGLGAVMAARVTEVCAGRGWSLSETSVIFAAHGSPSSDRPRLATEAAAQAMGRAARFGAILPCYVDEPPAIADVARVDGPAVVLPFFALRAGHVEGDLPDALAEAGFDGPVMDPVGLWPETIALTAARIAADLGAAAA